MLFGLLAAFYNAPEGVAAPLAGALGGGAAAVGVILAANSLGQTAGAIAFSRFVAPPTRLRFMGPLAISACAVLVLFFWKPGLSVSSLILVASGLCACYQLAANAAFVSAAPQEQRSQAFGLAQASMSLGQGVVMILAGAAAEHYSPARVVAVFGAVGAVVALAVAVSAARIADRLTNVAIGTLRVSPTWCRAWQAPFCGGWRPGRGQPHLVSRMAGSFPGMVGGGRGGVSPTWCRAWQTPFLLALRWARAGKGAGREG